MRPTNSPSLSNSRRLLATSVIALIFATGASIPAVHAENVLGGRIVEDTTLYVGVGFPQLELGAKFQLNPDLDIGARFSMEFARLLETYCCHLQVAADFRYRVIDDGPLQASLLFSVPLGGLTSTGTFSLGLLWPGFAGSYQISPDLDFDFGLQIQTTLYFDATTNIQAWVDVFLGLTYQASDFVMLGFRFDIGPDFYDGSFTQGFLVDLHLRGILTVGFKI